MLMLNAVELQIRQNERERGKFDRMYDFHSIRFYSAKAPRVLSGESFLCYMASIYKTQQTQQTQHATLVPLILSHTKEYKFINIIIILIYYYNNILI